MRLVGVGGVGGDGDAPAAGGAHVGHDGVGGVVVAAVADDDVVAGGGEPAGGGGADPSAAAGDHGDRTHWTSPLARCPGRRPYRRVAVVGGDAGHSRPGRAAAAGVRSPLLGWPAADLRWLPRLRWSVPGGRTLSRRGRVSACGVSGGPGRKVSALIQVYGRGVVMAPPSGPGFVALTRCSASGRRWLPGVSRRWCSPRRRGRSPGRWVRWWS